MIEEVQESLPSPEGPRYKILIIQLSPEAKPELKIAEGLFGKLEGREPQIGDYSHLTVSKLDAPTEKQVIERQPDLAKESEESVKLAREIGADELLKPEKFFKEPLGFYSAIIITGSPFAAYPRATPEGVPYLTKWKRELITYLRAAVEQEIPILGICFGAQILAEALGGETERMMRRDRGEVKEVLEWGWTLIRRVSGSVDDPIMKGLASEFVAAEYRRDRVSRLPPGAVLLAEGERGVQGFVWGKSVWALQFHLERPRKVVDNWLDPVKHPEFWQKLENAGLDPERMVELGKEFKPELMKLIFSNFLDFVRARIHG